MFELGWVFWVLFIAVFFGCGRMCGWGAKRFADRRRGLENGAMDEEAFHVAGRRSRATLGEDAGGRGLLREAMHARDDKEGEPVRLRAQKGSPLEKLQKDFIDGRLTVEEYERELDRLEKIE